MKKESLTKESPTKESLTSENPTIRSLSKGNATKENLAKYFKRNDGILLGGIALGILLVFGIQCFLKMNKGSTIEVSVDGQWYGTYELSVPQTIEVEIDGQTENVLEIKNGVVRMSEATCPDHLCIKQGQISARGETIVCLPHRVIVTVVDGSDAELDSMTR